MAKHSGILLVSALVLASGCSGGGGGGKLGDQVDDTVGGTDATSVVEPSISAPDVPAGDSKPWTVFVYMAADNNLEAAGVDDFKEMQAGVTADMNLVVLFDRSPLGAESGSYSNDPIDGVGDFTGARLLHVTPTTVEDLGLRGDVTMTDPAVLAQVGTQVFTKYPSERTALMMWDHAAGWHGFAADDSGGGSMSPDEVAGALKSIVADSGIDKLSIVGFDSCLMGQFEVAAALSPYTDLMLGSEEVMPSHGYDYSVLGDATSGSPENFGSVFLGGYTRQARDQGQDAAITDSMFDLTRVPDMQAALAGLKDAIAADPSLSVPFLQAVDGSLSFGYAPDQGLNFDFRDLGQIASSLAAGGTALADAAAAVDAAVSAMVVQHVEGRSFAGARGLSVYAPLSVEQFDTAFTDLSTAGEWSGVMDTAFSGGSDLVQGSSTAFVGAAAAEFKDGTFSIAVQADPAYVSTLTSVSVFYGAYVPAQDGFPELCLVLGETAGGVADAAQGIVGGQIPLIQLGISNNGGGSGLLGVFAAVPNSDTGNLVLAVPVTYVPPGGTVDKGQRGYLLLGLDANGAVSQRNLILVQENGTLGEVQPDPSGTLQTIVQQYGADGSRVPVPSELYTDPPSLPADLATLDIVAKPVAPGDGSVLGANLAIGVEITDAGGASSFTFSHYVG